MSTFLQGVRRSLFFRLSSIFGITVMLFIVILYFSFVSFNRRAVVEIDAIPDFFSRNIEAIIEEIGIPPNLGSAIRLADELDWSIDIRNPIMIWSSDDEHRLNVLDSVYSRAVNQDAEIRLIDNQDIIKVHRGGYDFYLYQRSHQADVFNYVSLYIGFALAALVLLINYYMVNRLLSPIRLLKQGAEKIRHGDLSYRVSSNRQDELGELTESINHMADSLQSMLEAKRQLLLAISHELRTPITRAKLRLEFLPTSIEKDELREDINEIDLLIADLLEAERLNNEHAVLTREPVYFTAFVEAVTDQFMSYPGDLIFDSPFKDVQVDIDKLRIKLLLANLVNNSIRHGENKAITVKVSFDEQNAILEVIDQGEGIAEEHLQHISEPFYRADSARLRDTGGFGLGLYLCNLIADAHGGKLNITSVLGQGTHITITLPIQTPEDS